jgi:hypothetical protein
MTQTAHRTYRTDDLTVQVSNGQTVTLNASDIQLIAERRNQATLHEQNRETRDAVFTRTALRDCLAERLNIPQALASTILSSVRTDDLYVVEYQGRPTSLDLAVRWERGWKTYEVTGTRHAYYLLRKLAQRDGFQGARLNDVLLDQDGWQIDNVISLSVDDVTGSDTHGKYRALLDRSNAHYDLERDEREV